MIFPSRSQLASKQITRTGRAEAVTKEGLAATLLPGRQPDQMGQRHSLRPVRPRSCPGPLRNGSLCCISHECGRYPGLVKRGELDHDTAVYRAARNESARLVEQGATIRRVRIDAEMKKQIARAGETARQGGGRGALEGRRRAGASHRGGPRHLPRRTTGVHRRGRPHGARQRRGSVGALPLGVHRFQGRRRVRDARQRRARNGQHTTRGPWAWRDLGRKVDLVERSIRRGEGEPELADKLKREARGTFH